MSLLDIIIIVLIIAFTIAGGAWGLIRQAIAVGGLIVGLILAGQLSPSLAPALGFINNPPVAKGLAFVAIVILVSIIASVLASVLYFAAGLLFLGLFDHLLGAVLGFIQGWLAVGVGLVAGVELFPAWTLEQLQLSFLANKVFGVVSGLALLFAPQELKDAIKVISDQLK